MSIQYSEKIRNARLDLTFSPENFSVIRVFTGPPPKTCDHPGTGTMLFEVVVLPGWFSPAYDGTKEGSGTLGSIAVASGKTGYFRAYDANGACQVQGGAGYPGYPPILGFENDKIVAGEVGLINRCRIHISP